MEKFLILAAVVIGVLACIQIVRVYELASQVRDKHYQEKVTRRENMVNANLFVVLMLGQYVFIIWQMIKYGNGGLGEATSIHGKNIDALLNFNWWIVLPTFFITNTVLFVFAKKYAYDPNRKAYYYPHNNKLEMIWTVVPAIALAGIIIYGLKTWKNVMYDQPEGTVVEVYAKQFDWTVRYSGADNELGAYDYKLIRGAATYKDANGKLVESSDNQLGVVTTNSVLASYAYLDSMIANNERQLEGGKNDAGDVILTDEQYAQLVSDIEKYKRQKYKIKAGVEQNAKAMALNDKAADDFIVKELHLIVNRPYTFYLRSQDVIHSFWLPHFRAQMNCVPGMRTKFSFTPTVTTKEFQSDPNRQEHFAWLQEAHNQRLVGLGESPENIEMNFLVLCNKICGASHSNMQMKVIVETEEEFKAWAESQTSFSGQPVKYQGVATTIENSEAPASH